MKIKSLILSLILISVMWSFTASSKTRCSKFGIYLLDDIFGLDGVGKTCFYESKLPLKQDKNHSPATKQKPLYYTDTRFKVKKDCPPKSTVILIIGQSNAANSGVSKITENTNNFNFNDEDGFCYELSEPVLGATGNNSSITSSIGKKIISNRPIIFLNKSVDGSSIEDWIKFYSLELNKILTKIIEKNNLKIIIWMQGESESIRSSKNYFKNFEILKSQIFNNLSSKFEDVNFIITKSTYCGSSSEMYIAKKDEIDSQRELIRKKYKNIKLLEITDNLNDTYRIDTCHFNSEGIDKISTELASQINLILKN